MVNQQQKPISSGVRVLFPLALVLTMVTLVCVGSLRVFTASPREAQMIQVSSDPLDKKLESVIDVQFDSEYKSPKRFRGISVAKYFETRGIKVEADMTDSVVEFLCGDGYKPVAELSTLVRDGAFLATSDCDAGPGEKWVALPNRSSILDLGPFYLVWPRPAPDKEYHPSPYGITAMRIGERVAILGRAVPGNDQLFATGFRLFKQHCMACHSINGVGGNIGVELNEPRNVFEYWQKDKLAEYVKQPTDFRRNAKMPPFAHLGPEAISDILGYVEHMKYRKIRPPVRE